MTDVSGYRSCGEYMGWVKTQAANNILVDADSFLVLMDAGAQTIVMAGGP